MNIIRLLKTTRSALGEILESKTSNRIVSLAALALCVAFSSSLLYSAFSALTHFKFNLFDYGVYTNMIWNSGHGDLFRVFGHSSYLKTHLSFTLALLGPLFRIWNHPFLLSLIQWMMIVGGALIIIISGLKHKIALPLVMATALFYLAYPFTQSVALSEFHGVSLYMLLIPWLYYCLCFRRYFSWVPLILILALREDAFIIIPILLYFAIKDRSKHVTIMLIFSLAFGLLDIFYLYPLINGKSLFLRRAGSIPSTSFLSLLGTSDAAPYKLRSLAWSILPAIFFLRRGWPAVLTFLSAPLIISLASKFDLQYQLKIHYPAAVMACIGIALVEASVRNIKKKTPSHQIRAMLVALILIATTMGAHRYKGYLHHGGKHKTVYAAPRLRGLQTINVATNIPKQGILIAPNTLIPFCANRAYIGKWRHLTKPERRFDVVFTRTSDLHGKYRKTFIDLLESGDFGFLPLNDKYIILQRGADTSRNSAIINSIRERKKEKENLPVNIPKHIKTI